MPQKKLELITEIRCLLFSTHRAQKQILAAPRSEGATSARLPFGHFDHYFAQDGMPDKRIIDIEKYNTVL